MNNYAVVYRDPQSEKIVRESGYTFAEAEKRSLAVGKKLFVNGEIHKMKGVASFKIK